MEEKKYKAKQRKGTIDFKRKTRGKPVIKIDIKNLTAPPSPSPYLDLIEGYQGACFNENHLKWKKICKGFTPGSIYNLFCADQDGISSYAVKRDKIEYLSYSEFSKEVKDALYKKFSAYHLRVIDNTLWIGLKPESNTCFRLELDLKTAAILKQEKLEKRPSKLAVESTDFTKNFNAKKNSKISFLRSKFDSLKNISSKRIKISLGYLFKEKFLKQFEVDYPASDHIDAFRRFQRGYLTLNIEEFDQNKKEGNYLILGINRRFILATMYSSVRRKVLKKRFVDIKHLLITQSDALAGGGHIDYLTYDDPIYSPKSKRLIFTVKIHEHLYLISLRGLFDLPSPKIVAKKIPEYQDFQGVMCRLIKGGTKPSLLVVKNKKTYYMIGTDETDKVLIVDPLTLETQIDLSDCFYAGKSIPTTFPKYLKMNFMGDNNRLVILGFDFSAIVEARDGEQPRVLNIMHHCTGFVSLLAQTASVDDVIVWNHSDKFWISRIAEQRNRKQKEIEKERKANKKLRIVKMTCLKLQDYLQELNRFIKKNYRFCVSKLKKSQNYLLSILCRRSGKNFSDFLLFELCSNSLQVLTFDKIKAPFKVNFENEFFIQEGSSEKLTVYQIEGEIGMEKFPLFVDDNSYKLSIKKFELKKLSERQKRYPTKKLDNNVVENCARISGFKNCSLKASNLHQDGFVCYVSIRTHPDLKGQEFLGFFDLEAKLKKCVKIETDLQIEKIMYIGGSKLTLHLADPYAQAEDFLNFGESSSKKIYVLGLDLSSGVLKRLIDYDSYNQNWVAQTLGESGYLYQFGSRFIKRCNWSG